MHHYAKSMQILRKKIGLPLSKISGFWVTKCVFWHSTRPKGHTKCHILQYSDSISWWKRSNRLCMMPYIHVRAWPWVQIVYQLLSYMYIWIIWIASVDSPKQSSRTLIMSIHIWTCCNWSPRASFGLYRCMYGHVGGCPQGMPKVIDHVQYLIFFWGAQTLESFMLSLNAVLVYGYPAHQVHGARCAYFARVLMCMGCLQFMSDTQCDVICIALAWLAYVLNLFYAFGPLYGYHHKTTKTQPNLDIFLSFLIMR